MLALELVRALGQHLVDFALRNQLRFLAVGKILQNGAHLIRVDAVETRQLLLELLVVADHLAVLRLQTRRLLGHRPRHRLVQLRLRKRRRRTARAARLLTGLALITVFQKHIAKLHKNTSCCRIADLLQIQKKQPQAADKKAVCFQTASNLKNPFRRPHTPACRNASGISSRSSSSVRGRKLRSSCQSANCFADSPPLRNNAPRVLPSTSS